MGSPEFSVPALRALLDAGHRVVCVYAQPARPVGRGQKERPCPVHAFALEKGLQVRTPKSLNDERNLKDFVALRADVCVVAAYGIILPKSVLDAPELGCLNIHASLLPRWRGAAPIQRAIIAGDEKSGVTIMQVDEGLDTGDILIMEETPITKDTTASDLHDRLSIMGAQLIVQALAGAVTPRVQPKYGVTYAAKLDRNDGRLDWSLPAAKLERRVRALNPWPGVWFDYAGSRLKVLAADVNKQSGERGTVLNNQFRIACGEGSLDVRLVQKEGTGALGAEDFLRGFSLPSGTQLA
jgi:methionyl-tRNA formyltransferase